jgi:hypothetical protein
VNRRDIRLLADRERPVPALPVLPFANAPVDRFEHAFPLLREIDLHRGDVVSKMAPKPELRCRCLHEGRRPRPLRDKYGRACLLARRLSDAGVRFVQVTMGGWDHRGDIRGALPKTCAEIDRPCVALIEVLKSRGLLDDTLGVWSGSRMSMATW